ncbi:MAG: branched-chain amino acid ABC transporter permease [Chloroflexi bacterium]|nr:branched-chain amino acid ABC transporter permease [Chloroflexota bacterium]
MTAVTAPPPTVAPIASARDLWLSVAIRTGLIAGATALYLCLTGIVPTFDSRPLIRDVITLGQVALVVAFMAAGLGTAIRLGTQASPGRTVLGGTVAGLIAGAMLSALVLLGSVVDLRAMFLHASPALWNVLTFEMGTSGFWVPAAVGAVLGGLAAAIWLLPGALRMSLLAGLAMVLVMGLFAGLLRAPMLSGPLSGLARQLFAAEGLQPIGALLSFAAGAILVPLFRPSRIRARAQRLSREQRRVTAVPLGGVLLLLVLLLPLGLGPFVAQVVALIALYVLMGLGLNITLGLAGLLDLGFVAFFAVGAYTVGLLTSTGEYGIAQWSFWAAVPVAVVIAMLFGVVLGLPLLGMRGDYLAIATLGFGEIIRILAGSDLLKPWLGGPRGITNIPKPLDVGPDSFLAGPNQIYYIALACAAVIAFVAWRLRASRLGRAWIAIREDEDVAEALGVNLVQTKILAYMLGAAFAGLGGAIFASLYGSVFPSSIQLLVSINVVAIIIVGGMGSIPGVVVGAIVLIGLPELFREFSEYRFLFYGAVLILMMRFRPEGLIPSRIGRQEMHHDAAEDDPLTATAAVEPS